MKVERMKKGFTLVEILLAMSITAIIGVTIYNMFWSAVKMDEKMRHVHDDYMEMLMADQSLSHDLENTINLNLIASYPDAVIFDGQKNELSFLTQTPKGIRRVRYYTGFSDQDGVAKSMIGRVVNSSNNKKDLPFEFLLRDEKSMADWLNETVNDASTQIVAVGLKKGSFNCRYALFVQNLHTLGAKGIAYQDTWDEKGLPMFVSCRFVLYDPPNIPQGLMFQRDIFLAPLGRVSR